jgi:ABC-type branched-subunit amino acid transport system permease subunit
MQTGLVLGVITGLTYGLLAVGIVLVFKANRFINVAHAQLGVVSALLLGRFVLTNGWSWWLAFPVVLAVGAGTGLVIERLVIQPMVERKRRGISLLLVSVGIAELLLALAYVKQLGPSTTKLYREGYPTPFDAKIEVGSVVLRSQHLLILSLVPLSIAALAAFLRFSVWGKAIRATASNADAARLCGISVRRVSGLAWALAGLLSALTAVLQAPSQGTFNAAALGPELLLRALGAAALGGFTSIPAALVGGLLLGEVEHLTLAVKHNSGAAQLMVFFTVIAILFVRSRVISRTADDAAAAMSEDVAPLRVPAAIAARPLVRYQRALLAGGALFVALLAPLLPYFHTEAHRFQLVITLVMAIVGVSLTMLLGWAGQVSLGHFAVLALGAYTAAKLGAHDLPVVPVLIIAGLAGALAMVIVGLPALRLRGLTLALTTLGFAVVAPSWLFHQPWIGASGQSTVIVPPLGMHGVGRFHSQLSVYYGTLALLSVFVASASRLRRSSPGRLVLAVRDNERSASSFGMTPATVKLSLLATSGFFVAAAGVLWGSAWRSLSVDLVRPEQSLVLLAIPVIGGLGSIARGRRRSGVRVSVGLLPQPAARVRLRVLRPADRVPARRRWCRPRPHADAVSGRPRRHRARSMAAVPGRPAASDGSGCVSHRRRPAFGHRRHQAFRRRRRARRRVDRGAVGGDRGADRSERRREDDADERHLRQRPRRLRLSADLRP